MKAIKVLLGTLTFLSATCSWGETFQCEMYGDAVEKGWLPATFTMEYAPDLTEIISPVSPVFGTSDFEKGFLGAHYGLEERVRLRRVSSITSSGKWTLKDVVARCV